MRIFMVAALGALLQELAHWYSLRGRLQEARYTALVHSGGYWIITVLMIAAGSAGTLAWYHETAPPPALKEYLIMGAAFPVLFKKAVQAFVTNQPGSAVEQGAADDRRTRFRDYFS